MVMLSISLNGAVTVFRADNRDMGSEIPPPWLKLNRASPPETPSTPPEGEAKGGDAQSLEGRRVVKDPTTGRFLPGSGGRPKGSRNRVSLAVDNLLDGESEAITRKCIELAKRGDPIALRLVMDRICPIRKGRALPKLERRDGEGSVEMLLRSVLEGEITPEEGKDVVGLIESAARVATAQALAEMRQRQLEVLERARDEGALRGGVMVVPVMDGDWECLAVGAQQQLKSKVRE